MKKFGVFTKPLSWFMLLYLVAFMAGCGNSILGGEGVNSSIAKSSTNALNGFLLNIPGATTGVTTGSNSTFAIPVTVPYATDLTNLTAVVATFTTTGTSVTIGSAPAVTVTSGQSGNFTTNPEIYTVYAADGSTATYTVTVTPVTVSSIAVTPATASIPVNSTQQFTATATYSDGSTHDVTATATWTSGTISYATIVAGGLATGVAAGTSNITATIGSVVSNSAALTVNSATLNSIAVTPATALIPINGTYQFTATGTYSDTTTHDVTATATWTSGTISYATIVAGGLATGVAAGTSNITAAIGSVVSSSATLTVTAASLSSIAVTPATAVVVSGSTQQFTATATYSDASTQPVTTVANWTSSSTGNATVGPHTGLATGGTANTTPVVITATYGGKTATSSLTVNAAPSGTVLPGPAGQTGANATNPTVIASNPSNGDTNVPTRTNNTGNIVTTKLVTATFDEAMDPATIKANGTFTLFDNTLGINVPGTVTMNVANTMATFTSTAATLNTSTNYTATVTTAAKNANDSLAMPKSVAWSFTTMGASFANQATSFIGQAPVDLLTAGNFVILAQAAITDANPTLSSIIGNVGTSPIAGSAMTITCPEVTGIIYAVDATGPGCSVNDPNRLTVAIGDKLNAYNEAAARVIPDATELGAGNISGLTIYPGLYKWSSSVLINTDVTLDAQGDSNAVWIFQIAQDLTIASGGTLPTGIKVSLIGKANAANVFWQVGGGTGATLNTNSTFNGNILSTAQVILRTGAVLNGRALAKTQVVLDANKVTQPAP